MEDLTVYLTLSFSVVDVYGQIFLKMAKTGRIRDNHKWQYWGSAR